MVQRSLRSRVASWFLDDLETKSAVSGLSSPEPWFIEQLGGWPAASGIVVNSSTAMRVPAVQRAVTLISTSVGTLPAKVFRRTEDGGKEADRSHSAYKLVHDDANPWTSAFALRTALTGDALLHGNGYGLAVRGSDGRVVELIRLDPAIVSVETDDLTFEPYYLVAHAQGRRRYAYSDILHIPALTGTSPILLAKEAIGLALALEQHGAKLFKEGGRPSGILSADDTLDEKAAKNIKAAWGTMTQQGGTALLDRAMKYQQLTLNSTDAQFLQNRDFQLGEIARAFGVPGTFIGVMDQATYANSEQLNTQFVRFCLMPWLRVWEAAYSRVLLSDEERETHTIEFVVDDLQRADFATRMEGYAKAIASRHLSPNEARAMENRPPYPGGDEFVNPNTMTSGTPEQSPPQADATKEPIDA